MVVALEALVPGETPQAMAITFGIVGATGQVRVVSDARKSRTDPDPQWRTSQTLTRFLSPTLSDLILLGAAFEIRSGNLDALGWMVAIVSLLTMIAVASPWD